MALVSGGATARAEEKDPRWPVRGRIAGEVKIAALEELGLGWQVEAKAEGLALRAERPGLAVEVILRPEAGGVWRWKVERGALDVAELWPLVRGRLGAEAAGWSASGRVELTGAGTWSAERGPEGELRVALREGWARSDELEAELSGVELDVATRDLVNGTLAAGQTLRVARIAAGNLALTDLQADFGFDSEIATLSRLEAVVFGGRVRLRPLSVSLRQLGVDAFATVEGVSVAELAKLTPEAVAGGEGRLDGKVRLTWSTEAGLKIVEGGLSVQRSDSAKLRLAPFPGFLSSQLPRLIAWLSPGLAADLRRIEMGQSSIEVSSMNLVFNPDGADGFRTAQVTVEGRPAGKSSVRSLRLEVNLSGDLTRVLMLGLSDKVTVEF